MTCRTCALVTQFVINVLLAFDRLVNAVLLGDPNATLSQRFALAERAGKRVGIVACRVLGWFAKDHCAHSLTPGSSGRELWAWSPPGQP